MPRTAASASNSRTQPRAARRMCSFKLRRGDWKGRGRSRGTGYGDEAGAEGKADRQNQAEGTGGEGRTEISAAIVASRVSFACRCCNTVNRKKLGGLHTGKVFVSSSRDISLFSLMFSSTS